MKIAVIGAGFVGKATAYMALKANLDLSELLIVDLKEESLSDAMLTEIGANNSKVTVATSTDLSDALSADLAYVCINTDPLPNGKLNCTAAHSVCQYLAESVEHVVLRSTVDADFFDTPIRSNVYYMPEFLREATPYEDAENPTRIVIGAPNEDIAVALAAYLGYGPGLKLITAGRKEAVVIKLFSNAYLATRIAFFNELEMHCSNSLLDTMSVIEGVTADPRIGKEYCRPSVAFGGYCLPKDTSTLQRTTSSKILQAVLQSNYDRIFEVVKRYRYAGVVVILDYEPSTAKEVSVPDQFVHALLQYNQEVIVQILANAKVPDQESLMKNKRLAQQLSSNMLQRISVVYEIDFKFTPVKTKDLLS